MKKELQKIENELEKLQRVVKVCKNQELTEKLLLAIAGLEMLINFNDSLQKYLTK